MKQFQFLLIFSFFFTSSLDATGCLEPSDDLPMGHLIQCENFDSRTLGDISVQDPDFWIHRDDFPDGQVISGLGGQGNVLEIKDSGGDLPKVLYSLRSHDAGRYRLSFDIFIEKNKTAFFSIQHDVKDTNNNWNSRFFFDDAGNGEIVVPGVILKNFKYEPGGRNRIMMIWDLDVNNVEFWINDFYIDSWDTSIGFRSPQNTLAAIRFFAKAGNSYFVDNFCIWKTSCFVAGIDSSLFINKGGDAICMENGWTMTPENARCYLYTSAEWSECETVCDRSGTFIRIGDRFEEDFKPSEIAPGFLRGESCILEDFPGGWSPRRLFGEIFLIYHPEKGPLRFTGFWTNPPRGSLTGYLFECKCPDSANNPNFCDKTEQVCLGAFRDNNTFPDLDPGFYYIVMVSPDEGEFGFIVSPDNDNCPGIAENIRCDEPIIGNLGGRTNKFDRAGTGFDAYAECYAGSRFFGGADTVFSLQLQSTQTVDIRLNSNAPVGLFLFNEACAENCMTYAETGTGSGAELTGLKLQKGVYYLIVDTEAGSSDVDFQLDVQCAPDENFNFFTSRRNSCPVDFSGTHNVTIRRSANEDLLDLQPNIHFSFLDENGDERLLDTVSRQFGGSEMVFPIPSDQNADAKKCAYLSTESFNILVTERNESNSIKTIVADYLDPGTGGADAEGDYTRNAFSVVQRMVAVSGEGFNISPLFVNLSPTPPGAKTIQLNPTFKWFYSLPSDADWVSLDFRSGPHFSNVFNHEPNEIYILATENTSPQPRSTKLTIFSTENSLLSYDLEITQLGKQVVKTDQLNDSDFIKIFPNPTDGAIFIAAETGFSGEADISLFDALGRKMMFFNKKRIGSEALKLDFKKPISGVYFLKIETAKGDFFKKIIFN